MTKKQLVLLVLANFFASYFTAFLAKGYPIEILNRNSLTRAKSPTRKCPIRILVRQVALCS